MLDTALKMTVKLSNDTLAILSVIFFRQNRNLRLRKVCSMKKSIAVFLLFIILSAASLAFGQVTSAERTAIPALSEPGLILSFDDTHHSARWVKQMPLFEKYQAKATFFINAPQRIRPDQLENLRKLAAAGHEIACHGALHIKAVDYIKEKGMEAYLRDEIEPANKKLTELGFRPKTFAYPMSNNNAAVDAELAKIFLHMRTGGGVPAGKTIAECDHFFVPIAQTASRPLFNGRGIDRSTDESLKNHVFPALERLAQRKEVMIFYAHGIDKGITDHHIEPEMLEKVMQKASELKLKFYTFSMIP